MSPCFAAVVVITIVANVFGEAGFEVRHNDNIKRIGISTGCDIGWYFDAKSECVLVGATGRSFEQFYSSVRIWDG